MPPVAFLLVGRRMTRSCGGRGGRRMRTTFRRLPHEFPFLPLLLLLPRWRAPSSQKEMAKRGDARCPLAAAHRRGPASPPWYLSPSASRSAPRCGGRRVQICPWLDTFLDDDDIQKEMEGKKRRLVEQSTFNPSARGVVKQSSVGSFLRHFWTEF